MSDFEVKFNTTQLLDGLSKPFHEANDIMARRVTQEVRANKWPWPRKTIRTRGSHTSVVEGKKVKLPGAKVGTPRNVIDQGTFSESQSNERLDANTHEHRFDTEYALAVILGATLSNGTTLPARDVFEEPLKKLPDTFSKLAKAELAKVKDPP